MLALYSKNNLARQQKTVLILNSAKTPIFSDPHYVTQLQSHIALSLTFLAITRGCTNRKEH